MLLQTPFEQEPVSNRSGYKDVRSTIYFLRKEALHSTEKPYAFRFDPGKDIQQSNFELLPQENVVIRDIRGHENAFTIREHGFAVLKVPQAIRYEDYHDAATLKRVYFEPLEQMLKCHLGATSVQVFRYGLRKRHTSFPISTGDAYEYDQPTSVAHVDTTPWEVLEEVKRQHSAVEANELVKKRVQWVNIWKPLRGPLNDWPLAVCDARTVDAARDLERADLLYEDLVTENYQVYFRESYKWYYLSDHTPEEMIVFLQSDTEPGAAAGVPHSSFHNPLAKTDEIPRESIEVRALVYYD